MTVLLRPKRLKQQLLGKQEVNGNSSNTQSNNCKASRGIMTCVFTTHYNNDELFMRQISRQMQSQSYIPEIPFVGGISRLQLSHENKRLTSHLTLVSSLTNTQWLPSGFLKEAASCYVMVNIKVTSCYGVVGLCI